MAHEIKQGQKKRIEQKMELLLNEVLRANMVQGFQVFRDTVMKIPEGLFKNDISIEMQNMLNRTYRLASTVEYFKGLDLENVLIKVFPSKEDLGYNLRLQ
ncbi:MAG: hypothetical protein EZS28_012297 [Streblomastix strix]|uniref:Uncharacterized protein n=1 Tax=Streblomastix strix TaxID=222440 RepID=A0A5J4WB53_9EUKA|nr:MAG: hypothetical protein EZS28_012297 [Streblomastix strix]